MFPVKLSILLVAVCCGGVLLRLLYTAWYNVFAHPLRSVPGPVLAKLFPQYMSLAMIQGRRAFTYGPIVRVGPNEVSFSDFRIYRQIYNQDASIKEESFYKAASLLGHDNISNIRDKSMHSARRKLMSRPFSQRSINENETLITELVERLITRILATARESPAGTTDVLLAAKLFSFEVLCRAAFNKDISSPSPEAAIKFLHAMEDSPAMLITSSVFPFLRSWGLGAYLPGSIGHAFRQYKFFEQYTRQLYREFESESKGDSTERFIGTPLLKNEDSYLGRTLNEDEAVEESMSLAFAGSGTTSVTIIYLLYELSRPQNRRVQLSLREELKGAGTTLADVKDLPYLDAVIKETMRLHPTIISTLPRTLTSPLLAYETVIPVGTTVGMQNYVHHRDPSVYIDPDVYRPERWIGQSQGNDVDKAFTPYSLGPRNCIGQNLANAELLLITSEVVRRLDLRLNAGMIEYDMEPEDNFAASLKGKELLLDVYALP
ncbi:hypothetical protein LTR84_007055 [Exophiala bonariae]|uniref:Cytochrome P450 n=1 Tax=Exophiala bonariae TaxID=1690606 RepID=A0AAV9N1P5_9EURO|nr:hypothetical protein LTR84_007055 [Exophiala bonariae]